MAPALIRELHTVFLTHSLDSGQGLHPHALGAEPVSTGLERLFNDDPRPGQLCPGLRHYVDQSLQGGAVG